jgi:hypothetical protein
MLIRDRAAIAKQEKEEKEQVRLEAWRKQLDAQSAPAPVEDFQEEKRQLAIAKEYANAPQVDPVKTWDVDTLSKSKQFSLEAYVAQNPESPYDDRSDKLTQIWKNRQKEPITAKDILIGVGKLPWTTAKHLGKFGKGTGTTIYDSTVAPLFGAAVPSLAGHLTGQGPEFQREVMRKQEEIDRNLASDLVGLEKGTFDFATWISNVGKTLPRRFANTKAGGAFGFDTWDDVPDDQLKREFQSSMESYLQGLRVGKGEGEFSQVVGGEFIQEAKETGGLDEDRIAAVAAADPIGFFLFGQAFRAVHAPLQAAATPLKRAQQLVRVKEHLNQLKQVLPPGDPSRQLGEALLGALEKDATVASRALSGVAKVTVAADRLLQAQLRLRTANEALKRFGPTAERQASVDSARAALQAAEEATAGQFGVKALASIRGAATKVSGVDLGVRATSRVVEGTGQALRPLAVAVEKAPIIGGLGLILTGSPASGLALLFGARATGLSKVAEAVARPLRRAQEGLGHLGRVIRSPEAATPYQKALQGLVRGSAETVVEGLKGVPIDVGFALALADSPEGVRNMSGYASAFRSLHAFGRPLARYTQAVKAGPQTPQAPAFLPRQAGNNRNLAALTEQWRRNLPPEQQQWVGAAEQWLRDIGSDAPVYGLTGDQFKTFLQEQFQRRNGRVPNPEEQAQIDQYSQTRGVFMEEVLGDNGQPGRAMIVTDAQAVPHEGMHAFQQVLGKRGNQFVDQLILEEFAPQEWDTFARGYAERLIGKESQNWREDLQPVIPKSILESVGNDPVAAADIFIAREIAAETFGELFKATGGRPQAPTTLVEKLATVVDRTSKFFGVDLLAEARTEGLGAPVKGRVLDAVRQQVQRQAAQAAGQRAEGTLPATEPSGRPTTRPPAPGEAPARPPVPGEAPQQRAPSLREPPIPSQVESEFQARTPERLNINLAREHAQRTGDAELQLTVDNIAQALQRKPGEAVVFEAENLSVVPSRNEAAFQRNLRRAEQAVPEAAREFFRKRIAVTRFLMDEFSGGKLQLAAMSMDKVLVNVFNLQERLQKAGATELTPYEVDPRTGQLTENGWNSLAADLVTYTANQANGYRGGGKELVRPEEAIQRLKMAIPEQNPNYRPTVLPDQVEQYLNVVMGIPTPLTAREFKGRIPGNIKGQVLREAQGEQTFKPSDIQPRREGKQRFKSFPEREVRETNPLRDEMTRRGVNTRQLLEVTERLNMDRVRNVTPRFDLQFNLPATDVIRAGFLPREAVAERPGFREQKGERRVEAAAFRLENGEVITGASHFMALLDAINQGKIPREVVERGAENIGEDGFVDSQGNFITRQEASQQSGQITSEQAQRPAFRGGELESTAFQESRQFLPKSREDLERRYPLVKGEVDGRRVLEDTPNMSSIEASLIDYELLPGVREVPMSDFTLTGKTYSVEEQGRIDRLAERIRETGEIAPLIVVSDREGPYILEGGHRADALFNLKAKSLPARVVMDLEGRQFLPGFTDESKFGKSPPPLTEAERQRLNEEVNRGLTFAETPDRRAEAIRQIPRVGGGRRSEKPEEARTYTENVPAPVRDHTADTITEGRGAKLEITKPLAESGVTVNRDGGISAGPALQAMPREWKRWLDENFLNNPEVRRHYSQREINSFARGMEQTAKLFGDFSKVPVEEPGSPIRQNSDPMFGLTFESFGDRARSCLHRQGKSSHRRDDARSRASGLLDLLRSGCSEQLGRGRADRVRRAQQCRQGARLEESLAQASS